MLLLHGLTASCDTQFFTAYQALAEQCSFIGIDHRGHGRGLRTTDRVRLDDMADDAAALLTALDVGPVITIGYSMGGPISLLLSKRHPHLIAGIIVQATEMEWRSAWLERAAWRLGRVSLAIQRSWLYPRLLRRLVRRLLPIGHSLEPVIPWITAELNRNDAAQVVQAGADLSRFDGRDWVPLLGRPAGMLVTTKDRLVSPKRQRELAKALQADVVELQGDHLSTLEFPDQYAAATIQLLNMVATKIDWSAADRPQSVSAQ